MQQATVTKLDWTPDTIAHFRWWMRDSKTLFGKRLGVNRGAIAGWESGKRRPDSRSPRALDKLASAIWFYG